MAIIRALLSRASGVHFQAAQAQVFTFFLITKLHSNPHSLQLFKSCNIRFIVFSNFSLFFYKIILPG